MVGEKEKIKRMILYNPVVSNLIDKLFALPFAWFVIRYGIFGGYKLVKREKDES